MDTNGNGKVTNRDLYEAIHGLNDKMVTWIDALKKEADKTHARYEAQLDKHELVLFGGADNLGLKTQVDRLEQSSKRGDRWNALIAAGFAAIAAWFGKQQ